MVDFEKSQLKALQKIQKTALGDAMAEQSQAYNTPENKAWKAAIWANLDELDELKGEVLAEKQKLSTLRGELAALEVQGEATPATPPAPPVPAQNLTTPAPVAGKRWTPEKLAELRAYRDAHTMPETVAQFGVSEARIRKLQPSKKPKAKPFVGLIHRMK